MKKMINEYWSFYKKGIISKYPPHIDLGCVDYRSLFKQYNKALYIRYCTDFDKLSDGQFYYVIKDGECEISGLPSKTRNMVRRCINNCDLRKTTAQEIITKRGYSVFLSENRRYARKGFASNNLKSEESWAEGLVVAESRGQDFFGCFINDIAIAYGVADKKNGAVNLVTWKCDYEKSKNLYPSYGLVYYMCNYYLTQEDVLYCNDGNRSFTEHSSVQDFLIEKFNFRKAYCKLHIHLRWYIRVIIILLSPFEKFIKNNSILSLVRMYKWSE